MHNELCRGCPINFHCCTNFVLENSFYQPERAAIETDRLIAKHRFIRRNGRYSQIEDSSSIVYSVPRLTCNYFDERRQVCLIPDSDLLPGFCRRSVVDYPYDQACAKHFNRQSQPARFNLLKWFTKKYA